MRAGDPAAAGGPILVAGMHCSGASLVASCLAAAGVDMGERRGAADAADPRGCFEDRELLALNARTLAAAVPAGELGCPDWGWTESERLDPAVLAGHPAAAAALAARRLARGRAWGFEDPRTTVLLDAWDEALGGNGARYLLVYRFPWTVADSMQRLGAPVFLENPEYAYRIWTFYNRRLLDFRRRHPERTLLLSIDALAAGPARLPALAGRLGIEIPAAALAPLLDRRRFAAFAPDDPLPALVAAASPEVVELLAALEREADLPADGLWSPSRRAVGPPPAPAGVPLSIVIPCHDMGELLLEAVASVERTVPPPYELLIVDDGSRQERTLAVLAALRRAGYSVLDQENAGVATARNRGIAATGGRYLLPLDADNRLLPGFAGAALGVLDADPAVGVVYGGRAEFGARARQVEVPELDLDSLLRANFIDTCAVLRREVWEQCGGFDAAMQLGWEDWDLWLGAVERGWAFHRLLGMTFEYRVRPSSLASGLHTAEVGVPLRLRMIDKHHDLYRRRLPILLTAQHETGLARAELAAVAAERDRLYAELAAWRRRVAFMERTRAWRLRGLALRLRSLLRL